MAFPIKYIVKNTEKGGRRSGSAVSGRVSSPIFTMKLLESAENYLETILVLQLKKGYVRSIDIASELQFSKPSVSIAMKKLRENGYINIDSAGHITLTDSGRDVAESVYGRHKVLCSYLMALGVDEENASRDACRIEHIVSEKTMECIRAHAAKLEQEHQNAE